MRESPIEPGHSVFVLGFPPHAIYLLQRLFVFSGLGILDAFGKSGNEHVVLRSGIRLDGCPIADRNSYLCQYNPEI